MGTFAELAGRDFYEEARPYDPTWRDQLGAWLMGDSISNARRDFVSKFVGSTGLGNTGFNFLDLSLLGMPFQVQEDYRSGNWKDIPIDIFSPVRSVRGAQSFMRASRAPQMFHPPSVPQRSIFADYTQFTSQPENPWG